MPSSSQTTTTNLHEFLSSVPLSLTVVLVRLAPCFDIIKKALEILFWSRAYDSWLALIAWWILCLFAYPTSRYFLPAVILLASVFGSKLSHERRNTLVTENNLQTAITDLTTIESLVSNVPLTISATSLPPISILLRITAILYPPYLLLTYYVPIRILIALSGTVLITWGSPWALVLRNTLLKSAWVRWSAYYAWSKLSGLPLPSRNVSYQTLATSNDVEPSASLRFLFTIFENQRWWMGLDFSPALLPGERPSWCSASLQPVSPPNAFSLPEPTSVYVRDSNGKRVKRTATWKWEEPEWKVVIRKEDGAVNRVEKPMPTIKEESSSLLMKAAGKMKEVNASQSTGSGEGDHQPSEKGVEEPEEEDIATDSDGWVYGDNKWEARTNKGGMGKYTRYRRWTRVAVVHETVQVVPDGETGIENPNVSMVTASPVTTSPIRDSPEGESPLRQRLKSALTKGTM